MTEMQNQMMQSRMILNLCGFANRDEVHKVLRATGCRLREGCRHSINDPDVVEYERVLRETPAVEAR